MGVREKLSLFSTNKSDAIRAIAKNRKDRKGKKNMRSRGKKQKNQ